MDCEDEWTPMIRRKTKSMKSYASSESNSSGSDSEINVSYSRKVE